MENLLMDGEESNFLCFIIQVPLVSTLNFFGLYSSDLMTQEVYLYSFVMWDSSQTATLL